MIFTEPRFLAFFAIVFSVHWMLRSNRVRKLWLLVCSYAFYAAWDWRFLSLIAFSTLVDYWVALALDRVRTRRGLLLALSVVTNLGLLGVFKYFDFFVVSSGEVLQWLGFQVAPQRLDWVLPVGISFFTFQSMSYTIDVYRRRIPVRRNLMDFALFVSFFPQLVAGPIVRASQFLPQLDETRRFASIRVHACLMLFLVGFVKKACVADNLAPIVDAYFAAPATYDSLSAWIAVLAYSAQIFCDFSGYSDMAIATAGLLGYHLPVNFRAPYLASSVTDFWRRWHITLSTWLRDYLYIPLGGNRGSRLFVYRNLMLTMLLGGLWHGAAWRFLIWGGLHGLALVVQREWRRRVPAADSAWARAVAVAATFYWVSLCWIFFRAQTLGDALEVLRSFVLLEGRVGEALDPRILLILGLLAAGHAWPLLRRAPDSSERLQWWAFALLYGGAAAVAISLVHTVVEPFIYFQF